VLRKLWWLLTGRGKGSLDRQPCPQCGQPIDINTAPRFPSGQPGKVLLSCGCGAWLPWPSVTADLKGATARPWKGRETK
jgi:hypothetical protein